MYRVLPLLACLLPTLFAAYSIETATVAAMRLAEAPNYSWSTTVDDDARSYAKQGKHLQEGYTWVTLPMIDSISRRLGRDAGTEIEAIFGADDACVIRLGERWKTVRQLPKAPRGYDAVPIAAIPSSTSLLRTPDMPADANLNPDPTPQIIVLTPPAPDDFEDPNKLFSNARLAASPPHEELALIVSSWTDVIVEGDTVRGALTDTGARLLLCPGSENESRPLIAAGEFTLHLKDHRVARYQLKLEGLLLIGKKKQVLVHQASDTTISHIGSTSFDLPDQARLALTR